MKYIKKFSKTRKEDVAQAGGKGASLGEMTQAGIPVPPGFVVLAQAFNRFLEETDLGVEVKAILGRVDHHNMETIERASEEIRALIASREMPEDIEKEVMEGFEDLGAEYVAVRSSATSEDGAAAAWAGQLDTFLNTTKDHVLRRVQECWASLFTPRAIFYRFEKELHDEDISVAVVIQKMVDSEVSGVAFSVHPVTEDYNQMIIEAGYGLGEAIVSGQVTPDSYVVRKSDFKIMDVNVGEQTKKLIKALKHENIKTNANVWIELGEEGKKQKLSEEEIKELAALVVRIEGHYGFPCDIEWAKEGDAFFITQSRPITTLSSSANANLFESELKQIKSIQWKYLVNRREALIFRSITDNAYHFFSEVTGIHWRPESVLRMKTGELLHDQEELEALQNIFFQGGVALLSEFRGRLLIHVGALDNRAVQIGKKDLSKVSNAELYKMLDQYFTLACKAQNFLLPMPVADKALSEMIVSYLPTDADEKEKKEWLATLTYPEKENSHVDEERSFYSLVIAAISGKKIDQLLEKHLTNFAWIGARGYNFSYAWNKEMLQERIREFIDQGKDPKEELSHLESVREERKTASANLVHHLKLYDNKEFLQLIELAKEFAYLRTWRTDIIYSAGYKAQNLFLEIARRTNIDVNDIPYFTFQEFLVLSKSMEISLSTEILLQRKENFITLYWGGSYNVLTKISSTSKTASFSIRKCRSEYSR